MLSPGIADNSKLELLLGDLGKPGFQLEKMKEIIFQVLRKIQRKRFIFVL